MSLAIAVEGLIGREGLPPTPVLLGRVDGIESFVSEVDVDRLLGARLSRDILRVAVRGRQVPIETLCDVDDVLPHGQSHAHVSRDKVLRLLRTGGTCVIGRTDLLLSPIEEVAAMLEDQTRLPWKATMFVTGPDSQGLNVHLDGESVVVIQLAGTKQWKVSTTPVLEDALRTQSLSEEDVKAHTFDTWNLVAGDVAWVPRGYAHVASAGESGSIHVSIALEGYSQLTVLEECVARAAADDPSFRRQLDADYWKSGEAQRKALVALLTTLLDRVADDEDPLLEASAHALYARLYWGSRRGDSGALSQALRGEPARPLRRLLGTADEEPVGAPDSDAIVRLHREGVEDEIHAAHENPRSWAVLANLERQGLGTARSDPSRT